MVIGCVLRRVAAFTLVLASAAAPVACAQQTHATPASAAAPSVAPSVARDYTAADVAFMQGMIGHHSQAIVMAAMAPSHGASPQVALFARKILRSQHDDIVLMENWLGDRSEALPDTSHAMAMHMPMSKDMPHDMAHMDHDMDMSGGGHVMLMPGMLTAEQLAQLDAARGTAFDRLFLTDMIQHHQGALVMVATLFDTGGAGQGPEIFGFASGVDADQRAEIGRMQKMLASLPE